MDVKIYLTLTPDTLGQVRSAAHLTRELILDDGFSRMSNPGS